MGEKPLARGHDWGAWETKPGAWTIHRNQFFEVIERDAGAGVRQLMIEALRGPARPSFYEAQRIKDELAGPDAVAVEVYPPSRELIDDSDHYHLWILPQSLPFSLSPTRVHARSTIQPPRPKWTNGMSQAFIDPIGARNFLKGRIAAAMKSVTIPDVGTLSDAARDVLAQAIIGRLLTDREALNAYQRLRSGQQAR